MTARHIVAIGGSDAGISAALRARELDPTTDVTVVAADAYPNFSICSIPYYVSGEVTHWTNLAHRTAADLAATGMRVLTDTRATGINVEGWVHTSWTHWTRRSWSSRSVSSARRLPLNRAGRRQARSGAPRSRRPQGLPQRYRPTAWL